jgi:hypothetical protein
MCPDLSHRSTEVIVNVSSDLACTALFAYDMTLQNWYECNQAQQSGKDIKFINPVKALDWTAEFRILPPRSQNWYECNQAQQSGKDIKFINPVKALDWTAEFRILPPRSRSRLRPVT